MNEMNNGENNFNNENQNNDNYQQQPVNNVQLEQSVNNQEPPKKEEKKSYCGLLIVFMVISLLLAGFIVYDKSFKKEEIKEPEKVIKNNTIKKIDDSKDWYYMKEINSYDIHELSYGSEKVKKITYEYPVINIDSPDARMINEKLQEQSISAEKAFINQGYPTVVACSEVNVEDLPYIVVDGSKKYLAYYDPYEYEIKKDENSLTIVSKQTLNVYCDWFPEIDVFVVSKLTGEKLSQKEIVESYGYNYEELLRKYNNMLYKTIVESYESDYEELLENLGLKQNPDSKDLENMVKKSNVKMVKISDKLELYGQPIYADGAYHYYYEGSEFKDVDAIESE